jgi:hypothetical protein
VFTEIEEWFSVFSKALTCSKFFPEAEVSNTFTFIVDSGLQA